MKLKIYKFKNFIFLFSFNHFNLNFFRLFQFRKIISQRNTCFPLVPKDYPVQIINEQKYPDCLVLEGKFLTPLELHLPGIVPKAAQSAHFQVVLPNNWKDRHKPMCIHLAGTGDHVSIKIFIIFDENFRDMENT